MSGDPDRAEMTASAVTSVIITGVVRGGTKPGAQADRFIPEDEVGRDELAQAD